jgi:ABC-type uncharacterized transport system permease subunit
MYATSIAFLPTLAYLVAAVATACDLVRPRPLARALATFLLGLGLVLRVATFFEPALCPVGLAGGGLGLVSMVLALTTLIGSFPSGEREATRTLAFLALVTVLDLGGQLFGYAERGIRFDPPPRERALGELHGGMVLLSYAAYLVAAVYSVLYLVMYALMKRRKLGFWFHRIPPLHRLEAKSRAAGGVGLVLLSIGLLLGFYTYWVFHGGLPFAEIKFVVAMVLWLLFAVEAVFRRGLRWHGMRVMWMPAAGALLIAVLYSVGGAHPFWSTAS